MVGYITLGIAVLILILTVIAWLLFGRNLTFYRQITWRTFRAIREIEHMYPFSGRREIPRRKALVSPEKKYVAEEKKSNITKSPPKTFYYLDETQVRDLYPQIIQDLIPVEMETREDEIGTGGLASRIGLKAGPLELARLDAGYEKSKRALVRKKYDLELTPPIMYNEIEKYFFEKGDVTFGIEDFEYDETAFDEFRSLCNQMQEQFGFEVPEKLQIKFISGKLTSSAIEKIETLSQITNYVAAQAKLTVTSVAADRRILSLDHPINKYLEEGDTKLKIEIVCGVSNLTDAGKNVFVEGDSVNITCVGKIVRLDKEKGILLINPISIY